VHGTRWCAPCTRLTRPLPLDLADAPRPEPDTPAPVRFLPAFDNAILGYHDRSRIINDNHRGLSVTGERLVLVDGRVAATWTSNVGTITVTPLRDLTRAERTAVAEEAERLATFLSDTVRDRPPLFDLSVITQGSRHPCRQLL
jgi:hypothetical protein